MCPHCTQLAKKSAIKVLEKKYDKLKFFKDKHSTNNEIPKAGETFLLKHYEALA